METISFIGKLGEKEIPLREVVYNINDFPFKEHYSTKANNSRTLFYNIPIVFDIETSNIEMPELRASYAFMYQWQLCIDDTVVFGRTWDEFKTFLLRMKEEMDLGKNHKAIIYVHNLGFEWQFMCQFLKELDNDIKQFYVKKRVPLVIRMENFGIEWRCSWKLSNMSAEKYISESESWYVKQTDIKYNYRKIRYPDTQLTEDEKGYCYCDVRGIADAIRREIDQFGNISNIPLTSTGFVRRDTLKSFRLYEDYSRGKFCNAEWARIFRALPKCKNRKKGTFRDELLQNKIDSNVYELLKKASRGGDTHANVLSTGKIVHDVYSSDRVSSYPAVQMTYPFPCGKWSLYECNSIEELEYRLLNWEKATLVTLYLKNIKLKPGIYSPYISRHKCEGIVKGKYDNGRLYKADALVITVTEVDYKIIKETYDYEIEYWEECYSCRKDYLPVPLRAVIMYYFIKKCELKGVDPYLYVKSKNKLNGIFGMTFTDIVHSIIELDLDRLTWTETKADVQESIDKYYNNYRSCLRYDWGVYTTAYARYELYQAVRACGRSYDYSDTDSVKWHSNNPKEVERIQKWFSEKNQELENKAIEMGAYYEHEGKKYILGIWEDEGNGLPEYTEFKTYGAKKYAYNYQESIAPINEKTGEKEIFGITVAGMSKTLGRDYIGTIDNFNDGLEIPEKESGRTLSVWRDEHIHALHIAGREIITAGSVCVLDTTYTLGMDRDYRQLVKKGIFDLK